MPSNSSVSNNSHVVKKNVRTNDNLDTIDHHQTAVGKNASNIRENNQSSPYSNHGNIRSMNNPIDDTSKDFLVTRSKDQGSRKFSSDYEPKAKCYSSINSDYGRGANAANHQEHKTRNNNITGTANISQLRFSNQSTSVQSLQSRQQRDSNSLSKISSHNDTASTVGLTTAHKALEQQNFVPKMGQINFPPLRAPQSIVNVRHPFVTESRIKQNDNIGVGNISQKSMNVATSSLQTSQQVKELEHNRQTYHGYSSSPIANIPNVQNLGNITSLAQYPRPDSFPQQTLASVLFPESSQFPQSPPYATTQVGQINQFQAYEHGSFTPTPVNVNSVIPQFPAESSQLSYPQYESPQFVQTNHYPTADIANGQYQYQATGVGQIADSSLYLQSLQSPLTVADQYGAQNYAQAVRTELIPRLRRPPRFNK